METPKIFESEYRFCLILWEHEPVPSGKLVELCKEHLGWSKATTYTVIRRLSERGVLKNENTPATSGWCSSWSWRNGKATPPLCLAARLTVPTSPPARWLLERSA